MKTIIFTFFLFLISPISFAAYERSEELLWACNSKGETPKEIIEKFHCIGYVGGILDGMQLIFTAKPKSRLFCPPKSGMSIDQQIKIITKYLENNPKDLSESSRTSIFIAYKRAFPCK